MSVQTWVQVPRGLRPARIEITGRQVAGAAAVAAVGLGAGALTAYGQGQLPAGVAPLANSAGPWVLIATGTALGARRSWSAAAAGALALMALLTGYVVADALRGYPSAPATIEYWGLAAVFIGPVLGLAAYWLRSAVAGPAALGAGLISGVLIGEAGHGLTALDQPVGDRTTGYWWAQVAVGVLLLLILGRSRFRALVPFAQAVLTCALVTAGLLSLSLLNLLLYVG
jgi:hypothetical protein